jgi:SAM-dependent methyltransferase
MADQAAGGRLSPWLKKQRYSQVAPFVRGSVLDYGCGTGDLLAYCRPRDYCGYDPDQISLDLARARHPGRFFTSDFSAIQKERGSFDAIVMAAVIEHLSDPLQVLRNLSEQLASEGVIIVTTPHPAWRRFHDLGAGLGLFSREASREHKTFLDAAGMARLAGGSGLRVQRAATFLLGANQLFILGR